MFAAPAPRRPLSPVHATRWIQAGENQSQRSLECEVCRGGLQVSFVPAPLSALFSTADGRRLLASGTLRLLYRIFLMRKYAFLLSHPPPAPTGPLVVVHNPQPPGAESSARESHCGSGLGRLTPRWRNLAERWAQLVAFKRLSTRSFFGACPPFPSRDTATKQSGCAPCSSALRTSTRARSCSRGHHGGALRGGRGRVAARLAPWCLAGLYHRANVCPRRAIVRPSPSLALCAPHACGGLGLGWVTFARRMRQAPQFTCTLPGQQRHALL